MPAFHQNELFENLGTFTESDAMKLCIGKDCYGINELNLSKIVSGDAAVMRIVDECHRLGKPSWATLPKCGTNACRQP